MDLNRVEIVTVLAIIVIAIILTIYLTILKRNGWFDRSDVFYRCPNPDCKKMFHKPIEVRDLSETPIGIYPACPECGTDLRHQFSPKLNPSIPSNSGCKYYFGYLSKSDKKRIIPKLCLKCPRSVDCMLFDNKSKDPSNVHFY